VTESLEVFQVVTSEEGDDDILSPILPMLLAIQSEEKKLASFSLLKEKHSPSRETNNEKKTRVSSFLSPVKIKQKILMCTSIKISRFGKVRQKRGYEL
jgi:hypothetical protein